MTAKTKPDKQVSTKLTPKRLEDATAEEQAQSDLDRWQNTPAENPFYEGKTPLDMAKVLLKPLKGKK